jgi:DNA-binding CsgD family transcriptional regulator
VERDRAALRAQHEIGRLCHAGLDSVQLRREVMEHVDRVVPTDAWCFPTADPATLMITGNVGEGLPPHIAPLFARIEYSQEDFNKFDDLARRDNPVADLAEATEGELSRSVRWREVFHPIGLDDDLRAALVADGTCWGFLSLHRASARGHFTAHEGRFVTDLVPHLAEALRVSLIIETSVVDDTVDGPGLILLDDALEVTSTTPAADRWLAEMAGHDHPDIGVLPSSIYAVAARLRAIEQQSELAPELMPRARLRTRSGRWVIVHASRLATGGRSGAVAVILEPGEPAQIAPLIVRAYGLTERERDIAQQVIRGLSTSEIAELLYISANTVQDHLKAIFEKVGVHSRRELVARVWTQQYWPRVASGAPIAGDGWFQLDKNL